MIELTSNPIDVSRLLAAAQQPAAGAVVLFLGTTRQFTAGRETVELQYEAYLPLAENELARLEREAAGRWPLVQCAIVHRVGVVPLAEVSVAIAVSSAHRDDAYAASRWIIDELKRTAPIWKREQWADGGGEWVHPDPLPETCEAAPGQPSRS
jgi:molybdopterin synthase catalytic subunit